MVKIHGLGLIATLLNASAHRVGKMRVFDQIENVVIYSLFDDYLRRLIGFNKVSRFYEGGGGWYFWLKGKPGVHELEVVDCDKTFAWSHQRFRLRYYPHPEEAVFRNFSFFEQVIRMGDGFSQGCPGLGLGEQFHESYYVIGELNIFLLNKAILAIVTSQDRWIEYRQQGLEVEKPTGERVCVVKKGEKDRDVPGWGLSWECFNCLIKAFCCIYRTPPSMVRLKSYPGKVWYLNGEGKVREEFAAGIYLRQLQVAIVPEHEKDREKLFKGILQICNSAGEGNATAVEALFSGGEGITQVKGSSFLNKDWWQAAEEGKRVLPREFYI